MAVNDGLEKVNDYFIGIQSGNSGKMLRMDAKGTMKIIKMQEYLIYRFTSCEILQVVLRSLSTRTMCLGFSKSLLESVKSHLVSEVSFNLLTSP